MKNIVILDAYTTNPGDLSWDQLSALGNLIVYDRTPVNLVIQRAKEADIILINKTVIDEQVIQQLPKLQCISVLATGYNVVDVKAAYKRGIIVCNVRGYAANAVAQHVFAMMLEWTSRIHEHARHVASGGWKQSVDWSYRLYQTTELSGKTIGIYGFGQIGQKVSEIALAFGMRVIAHHKHPERDQRPGVTFVSFEQMMRDSDFVTLHAPLSVENQGVINYRTLSWMKPSALLINTGRGGLVQEPDLRRALEEGIIAGAALDVLSAEPPTGGNILIGVKNCLITPHIAWATREARARLIEESVENVKAFLNGKPRNETGK
jgi:glycerate dehydrogenase